MQEDDLPVLGRGQVAFEGQPRVQAGQRWQAYVPVSFGRVLIRQ